MNNEFVSYEMALELKKLGFDEPCIGNYRKVQVTDAKTGDSFGSTVYLDMMQFTMNFNKHNKDTDASAPTFSQAFRFFREKYQWQASIEATKDQHSHELGYNYFIWNNETGLEYSKTASFKIPIKSFFELSLENSLSNKSRLLIDFVLCLKSMK